VPAVIAIAWYCTVMNSWRIARRLTRHAGQEGPLMTALTAGILTLGLDYVLEPVAGYVERYWIWAGRTIPVQNYLSWFLLSTIAVYVLARTAQDSSPAEGPDPFPASVFLFASHFILFLLTSAVHGYLMPSVLALCMMLVPLVLSAFAGVIHHRARTVGR
jgi:uncharacterized membrane protein